MRDNLKAKRKKSIRAEEDALCPHEAGCHRAAFRALLRLAVQDRAIARDQFLVRERTATGQVFVTNASYNALINSFTVAARVGVNEGECSFGHMKSYPFALLIAPKPPKVRGGSGYDIANFGDGCKQPQSGVPSPASSATPPP